MLIMKLIAIAIMVTIGGINSSESITYTSGNEEVMYVTIVKQPSVVEQVAGKGESILTLKFEDREC